MMPRVEAGEGKPRPGWGEILGGLRFIWRCKPVLGAISLDLVASLFGGVQALLPIFARDILEIGPWGYGLLRSSAAFGALLVAAYRSKHPVEKAGGWNMFIGMSILGVAVFCFGLSRDPILSIFLLMIAGAGDMASTIVRHTLIQVNTPPEVQGRVYAVSQLFVSTGGQLGQFQQGTTASIQIGRAHV